MAIGKKITPFKKASPFKQGYGDQMDWSGSTQGEGPNTPGGFGGVNWGKIGKWGGITAGAGLAGYGLSQLIRGGSGGGGLFGGGNLQTEANKAREQLAGRLTDFEGLDTSNLYAGYENTYADMENTYEDLTVNQQQAQFMAQQTQQQQASIMQGLSGAAGASGVGGLAQAMANQGQLATQKASASIGLQEQQNQLASAKGAAKVQYYERAGAAAAQAAQFQGAADARSLEYQKTQGLLAAATGRVTAANQAVENQKNRQMQLWTSVMGLAGNILMPGSALAKSIT